MKDTRKQAAFEIPEILGHQLPPGLTVEPRGASHPKDPLNWNPTIERVDQVRAEDDDEEDDVDSFDFVSPSDLVGRTMGVIGEERKEEPESNTCRTCGKVYQHRRHLQRHQRYECADKGPQFVCPICFKCYRRPEHLKRHGMHIHRMKIHAPRHMKAD